VVAIHNDGPRVLGVTIETEGAASTITADYYIAALPVEVMTPLLTPELKQAAPSLANLDRLQTRWMNGIQFYLKRTSPSSTATSSIWTRPGR